MVLKLAPRRASSSCPCSSMRCPRSCVSVTSSASVVSFLTGFSAFAPRGRRGRPPRRFHHRDEDHDQADPVEQLVDLVERANELQREALVERHGQHPHVRARHRRVGEELFTAAAGGRQRVLRDRELGLGRVGARDAAVLTHRLDEDSPRLEPGPRRARQPEDEVAALRVGDDPEWPAGQELRTLAQRLLHLAPLLVADEDVDDRRRRGDGLGDRQRRYDRLPKAKAHAHSWSAAAPARRSRAPPPPGTARAPALRVCTARTIPSGRPPRPTPQECADARG